LQNLVTVAAPPFALFGAIEDPVDVYFSRNDVHSLVARIRDLINTRLGTKRCLDETVEGGGEVSIAVGELKVGDVVRSCEANGDARKAYKSNLHVVTKIGYPKVELLGITDGGVSSALEIKATFPETLARVWHGGSSLCVGGENVQPGLAFLPLPRSTERFAPPKLEWRHLAVEVVSVSANKNRARVRWRNGNERSDVEVAAVLLQ